jgi:hypothetical protein
MKIEQAKLIEDLKSHTLDIIVQAKAFKSLPTEQVNWKSEPGSWSVLECLEHLNLFGDFYLNEIEGRISNSKSKSKQYFKSGWFGNYFANAMLPKNGKVKKIKTFRGKDPANSALTTSTIDRFLKQQDWMLTLLQKSEEIDFNKVKTSIAIPVFKIKLGDTFRVVIYHNQRHIWQAENVLEKCPK